MAQTIVVVDTSRILEGKADELETAVKELVAFVQAREVRPIAYDVYLDEERTRMTIVQVHAEPASMEHHLAVAAPLFRKLIGLVELTSMDVYGTPGDRLMKQIRRKVEALGNPVVSVHEVHVGLDHSRPR
jgi:hypothetical protein